MARVSSHLTAGIFLTIAFAFAASCGAEDDEEPDPGEVRWVGVPGGTFTMGCVDGDATCPDDEKPAHAVSVTGFDMLETEVTHLQFRKVMGAHVDDYAACSRCPVDSVTWDEADAYCRRIGGRLPSEAEWEYAARAGGETIYICGEDAACLDDAAWNLLNAGGRPREAATKAPNAFGLHDMSGNAMEWTADYYDGLYYGASPEADPRGPAEGTARVARGGSWLAGSPFAMRLSYRSFTAEWPEDGTENHIGFRCVRDR